jgi:predicted transcriptional regulator
MYEKTKTRLDQVRDIIKEQSRSYGGNFFSTRKNRNEILFQVNGLTDGILNRYINMLKEEGFLSATEEGRGYLKVNF